MRENAVKSVIVGDLQKEWRTKNRALTNFK
jgi:hypothetical protein